MGCGISCNTVTVYAINRMNANRWQAPRILISSVI